MVGQYCGSKEKDRKVVSLCGLHGFKQGLSERSLPYASHRVVGRCNRMHPRMSFLDAFQEYHQIPLVLEDQEKTVFVTPTRNYHYKVMPFCLKNVGSTYQRMMTKIFEPQLERLLKSI